MPRPRIHPEGTTPTERVAASIAALRDAGGARKCFRLSPAANEALRRLVKAMGLPTETAVIEELLLAASQDLQAAKRGKKKV